MSYKKLYAKSVLTKEQFLTILKRFFKKLPKKLFLLEVEYKKGLDSPYTEQKSDTFNTNYRLFTISMIGIRLEVRMSKNKNPYIYLLQKPDVVWLTVSLIRTYIKCTNFESFYEQKIVLLAEIIYRIQCYVYIYFVRANLDSATQKMEMISALLYNKRINYKRLTYAYMRILLKYAHKAKKKT
jgi:hypothetical protein